MTSNINLFFQFLLSFIAGIGFSILFSVNKRNIFLTSLCSGISWFFFQLFLSLGINSIFSTLLSGIILGFCTEIFARINKSPALSFILVGIIPLVPGLKTYKGMINLINNNTQEGVSFLLEAAFIAVAIAVSILVTSSIANLYNKIIAKK